MKAERCPICGGNGIKKHDFYQTTTGTWTDTGTHFVPCKSCGGLGYVLVPETSIVSLNN